MKEASLSANNYYTQKHIITHSSEKIYTKVVTKTQAEVKDTKCYSDPLGEISLFATARVSGHQSKIISNFSIIFSVHIDLFISIISVPLYQRST